MAVDWVAGAAGVLLVAKRFDGDRVFEGACCKTASQPLGFSIYIMKLRNRIDKRNLTPQRAVYVLLGLYIHVPSPSSL